VAGEEHRHFARREPGEQIADRARRDRIDAFERLVEKYDARPVNERAGKRDLLAHAVAVIRDELVGIALEIEQSEQLARATLDLVSRQLVHPADEGEVLATGETLEQRRTIRDHADLAAQLQRVLVRIESIDADRPRRRLEEPDEHAHRRGFSRAIRSEKSEHRSSGNREIDAIDSHHLVEGARQSGRDDGRIAHELLAALRAAACVCATFSSVRTSVVRCASVCPAQSETRSRQVPGATVGGRMPWQ